VRIGFAGNGSVGDQNATVRDGTVEDRWELFRGLEEAGVEVVYLGPPARSPGDPRVTGYAWEGELDALVLEVRDAVWPANIACLVREGQPCDLEHGDGSGAGGAGYLGCVHFAMAGETAGGRGNGEQAYTQALTIGRWARGAFNRGGERPVVLAWDFDLNVRRALGVNGRTSTYEVGAFWRKATPWMQESLTALRADPRTRWLCPYDPARAPWRGRKSGRSAGGGSLEPRLFRWTYPARLETGIGEGKDWSARTWDMAYTGSDYDRRERWVHYYVDGGLRRGARVAVTGTWGDRRGGREDGEYGKKGFRTWLSGYAAQLQEHFAGRALVEGGFGWTGHEGELAFLSKASTVQLPYIEAMRVLDDTRVSVQVVPPEYRKLGYHTNRWSEIWARGCFGLLDPTIADAEAVLPPGWAENGILNTDDPDRVERSWRLLREGNAAMVRFADDAVGVLRATLRERYGRRAQAERLLGIVEEARGGG
jgi:hypothetical protein